jgi:hypothetical protein
LGKTDKAVFYLRQQEYDKALCIIADSIDQINSVIEAIISDRSYFNLVATESILEMLSGMLEAKKNRDFILLADLLELQLINFLCGVQELIISKEEIVFNETRYKENISILLEKGSGHMELLHAEPLNPVNLMEQGYRVEFTSCGLMTLAAHNEGSAFYFHSNSLVQSEAFQLARHWLSNGKKRYILYGLGMGYHIRQLQELSPEMEIDVYETDPNVVQLACAFTDLKEILLKENTKLYFDPEFYLLKERIALMTPDETVIVHYPSYKNIRSREGRELLETFIPWSKTIESC